MTATSFPSIQLSVIDGPVHGAAYLACKRAVDILLSLILLGMLSPLMLLIVVAIRLASPGPAIFRQQRVGSTPQLEGGRLYYRVQEFEFYKFRSMLSDADPAVHQAWVSHLARGRASGTEFKLKKDSRITPIGRFLRKTSLDELPQLINVLKGNMTFVGPRPVPSYEVALYERWQYQRLAARPGITGLWQVKGRGGVSFDEMIRMDLEYVKAASFWLDVKLLFLTIPAVLSGTGAE